MNDRASDSHTPTPSRNGVGGAPASTDAQPRAAHAAEPDLQAVLDAVAVRLDEVLAEAATDSENAAEGHEGRAVQGEPRVAESGRGQERRPGEAAGDGARTDEAEQRLRAARERMTRRHTAARAAEAPSTTVAGRVPRGVRGLTWTVIGLVAIAAVAALVIVWLR